MKINEGITMNEAAALLGVSSATVRNWAVKGHLTHFRLPSGRFQTTEAACRELLEKIASGGFNEEVEARLAETAKKRVSNRKAKKIEPEPEPTPDENVTQDEEDEEDEESEDFEDE